MRKPWPNWMDVVWKWSMKMQSIRVVDLPALGPEKWDLCVHVVPAECQCGRVEHERIPIHLQSCSKVHSTRHILQLKEHFVINLLEEFLTKICWTHSFLKTFIPLANSSTARILFQKQSCSSQPLLLLPSCVYIWWHSLLFTVWGICSYFEVVLILAKISQVPPYHDFHQG